LPVPLTASDIDGFFRDGFVVIRDAIPASLTADLRRECDKAVAVIRRQAPGYHQRFQPVNQYAEHADMRVFQDYAALPSLNSAFKQVLGADVFYGRLDVMGVFIEPPDRARTVAWHRDMFLEMSRLGSEEAFKRFALDWDSLNQINAALYNDDSTWYVPGSHLRIADTPTELAVSRELDPKEEEKLAAAGDFFALERRNLDHVRRMPGARQVHLFAGDLLLYRAVGWHCGNYVPYRKRATILDVLYSPAYYEWRHAWLSGGSPKWKPGKA
jgi:hypothetical protein